MILSIFLPNAGCKHRCKFCNQYSMTGEKMPTIEEIRNTFKLFKEKKPDEIAFYGGTFTGLNIELQEKYLKLSRDIFPNLPLRISTRPDEIKKENLELLKKYNVQIVEIGIQSMYDDVLDASSRGHTVKDNINAVKLLLENGFTVSAHLMVGLPLDNFTKSFRSLEKLINLNVKLFRIHPTIVFKNTLLEKEYLHGKYVPLSLKTAVNICSEQQLLAFSRNVNIIRLGYFVPENQKKEIVAGPYHPSFGDIVKAEAMRKIITRLNIKQVYFPRHFTSWFYSYENKKLNVKKEIWNGPIMFDKLSLQEASSLSLKKEN
ncbi:MAG: radical SAM protein [Thermosipho sp. (in: Bacteria)]|nr:radical SAM protein [Thermosipho sp. (in: thermotogales)]